MKMKATRVLPLLLAFTAACAGGKERAAQTALSESADINMQVASSDIEAAKKAGAVSLAPQELEQARTSLRTAGEQYRAKNYAESRRLALAASEAAKAAKAKAESAKQDKAKESQAVPPSKAAARNRTNPK